MISGSNMTPGERAEPAGGLEPKDLRVFFDTSLLIDLLYTRASFKRLGPRDRAYFARVADNCVGYISPITWMEFWSHGKVRRLKGIPFQIANRRIRRMVQLSITPETAEHYLEMAIPKDYSPGPLDAWQIVLAQEHGLMMAATDNKMLKHAVRYVEVLLPTTHPLR